MYYSFFQGVGKHLNDKNVPLIVYVEGGPGYSSQWSAFDAVGNDHIIQDHSLLKKLIILFLSVKMGGLGQSTDIWFSLINPFKLDFHTTKIKESTILMMLLITF